MKESRKGLNTPFIKLMKVASALVNQKDIAKNSYDHNTIHILMLPSFFLTNKAGEPHVETLGWIKPLSRRSWI